MPPRLREWLAEPRSPDSQPGAQPVVSGCASASGECSGEDAAGGVGRGIQEGGTRSERQSPECGLPPWQQAARRTGGASRKTVTGREMGRHSGLETGVSQARHVGLSQHRNQEKVPQGHPQIKGCRLLAAGHLARHLEKETLQKISSKRKWFAFPS